MPPWLELRRADARDFCSFRSVFGLSPDVVAATLGDVGVQEVVGLSTGVSLIFDVLLGLP